MGCIKFSPNRRYTRLDARIDSIAEQFGIGQKGISVKIIMENFKEGTFH